MATEDPPFTDKIPTFSAPTSFLTPQISNLISDPNHLKEDGISFTGYRRCNPDDSSEVLKSGGRSLNFLFQVGKQYIRDLTQTSDPSNRPLNPCQSCCPATP